MTFLSELRHAARALVHAPGFSLAVILTMGLGIGANAAIFSVVRGILLRPLPNQDEARLVYLRQSAGGIGAENAYFSVPEIADFRAGVRSLSGIGEFSTMTFTAVGLADPRELTAGLVDGRYFTVMGLRPVLGRLLGPEDDGPAAAGAVVLSHRFWTGVMGADAGVLGRQVRLGTREAVIVGVLEPSIAYPTETEIFANVVTSPHHMSAAMTTDREHRMTELFGRLAPGVSLTSLEAELQAVHGAIKSSHPSAYEANADFRIDAVPLREQITTGARTMLLILLTAAGLVFVVACANVANLVLARALRREPELAVRAALGASRATLRRVLLAECLLLSGAGALVGLVLAGPSVAILARYAARFTIRAEDLTLDSTLLWTAAGLAMAAAVLFAFIPRLPSGDATRSGARSLVASGSRTTGGARTGQRVFAIAQIAASFVLLAGAGLLARTLVTLQAREPGFETTNVLAVNVPVSTYGRTLDEVRTFYDEIVRRVARLPGVRGVAVGSHVPWRDVDDFGADFQFRIEGGARDASGEDPRARFRSVSPGFFPALGIPLVAGRDFNADDRDGAERVVIVSESLAQRLVPGQDVVGRALRWTDARMRFVNVDTGPRRIVGVAADVRDGGVAAPPEMTVYHPFHQEMGGGRLFVHAGVDPYSLVPSITRAIHGLSIEQPVERAASLADVRTEVLAPSRLNAIVLGGFAVLAVAIAVVGVAGVLAFSVSGRTREFGIRLALGSHPRGLLTGVIVEGAVIAVIGIAIGGVAALALTSLMSGLLYELSPRDPATLTLAALLLGFAAIVASAVPAARAARVDVLQALRAE
jgi:predicted permease